MSSAPGTRARAAPGSPSARSTFAVGPPDRYPYLYVDGLAQNYWIDIEATPPLHSDAQKPGDRSGGLQKPMSLKWLSTEM